ncbi:tyrosine-type recombinase/integrase [Clostridium paraputrificum]|uniref:tyrosine-type recombinase/integrase n=1 Tax=Clostridium paraputrificum TaxID=29363 RepID=UPI00325AF359
MSKEIIDVYKANYLTESYHQLVQSKIREFVHYYNFCFDNKLKVGETKSIKKYKEFKCFDKSNRYTNDVINSLRGYFNAAIKLGYYQDLKSNPVKMTLNVRESKFSKLPDKKIIPPKEVEKLFAIFSKLTKFERLFIMLLYYTGLRIGEALNLTIGCVVKITDNAVTMVIPPFKSRKKPYSILIEDLKVINVIEELILLREGCGRVPHYKTGKAGLFLLIDQTDDGRGIKHLTPEKANRIIEKACSMAGIQKYTNHCFRHTLAHRLLNEEKYDLEDVSALLGHRCLDTIKIYTRLTNEEKLLFYSRYLNRRDAVRKTKSYSNELKVTLKDGRQVIIGSSEGFNRWNGNGFCSHEGEEKCPKKYRSCYTCSLFVACKEKSENMEDDFIINLENLKKELKKTIPIYKEIQFYYNILTSILNHLSSLGVSIEYLLDLSNQSINEAKMILKEMKY